MSIRSQWLAGPAWATCALAACLLSPLAMAAAPGTVAKTNTDLQAQYKADVAFCNSGQSNEDKPTCLREAGAALEEARRNRLGNGNQAFDKNEVARCQALPAAERDDCMLQMSGKDTITKGSVGAGGVLRETTITIPGK